MNAKPQTKKPNSPSPYTRKFIDIVWDGLGPAQARLDEGEPACMNMTRNPATSVQTKLTE